MKVFVFLCLIVTIISAKKHKLTDEFIMEKWQLFKNEFSREYETHVEENLRYNIFMKNLEYIEDHNKKYEQGLSTFELGVNQFADKLHSEFIQEMLLTEEMFEIPTDYILNVTKLSNYKVEAEYKDYAELGGVTPVKNQGKCSSCYAFAVVGAVETYQWKKTKNLIALSEQNIIDCAKNDGCNGGKPIEVFKYIQKFGIDNELSYPYKVNTYNIKNCRYKRYNVSANIRGYGTIPKGDEKTMKLIVANEGPVAIIIDANHDTFRFYRRGYFHEPKCSPKKKNHGMVIVGYGKMNGKMNEKMNDYWKVKNSWGIKWGEKGYIRMARNRNNNCGIASNAAYPK